MIESQSGYLKIPAESKVISNIRKSCDQAQGKLRPCNSCTSTIYNQMVAIWETKIQKSTESWSQIGSSILTAWKMLWNTQDQNDPTFLLQISFLMHYSKISIEYQVQHKKRMVFHNQQNLDLIIRACMQYSDHHTFWILMNTVCKRIVQY